MARRKSKKASTFRTGFEMGLAIAAAFLAVQGLTTVVEGVWAATKKKELPGGNGTQAPGLPGQPSQPATEQSQMYAGQYLYR